MGNLEIDESLVRSLVREQHPDLLAPGLPLPVPAPVRIGEPSTHFPQPWTITT
jgi:hypothetical protein